VRIPFPNHLFPALAVGICLLANHANAQNSPFGIWRGESLCATAATSCHDEKVVYYIDPIADKTDMVSVRADKIVDGKAITMGSGPWKYSRDAGTMSWESDQRIWLLHIDGARIEGTLTVPDKVVFRRMTLTRSAS
jgi:hypothetical protein